MKLALLQCDSVQKRFQKQFGNYPQMFIELFATYDTQFEIEVFNVQIGEYPLVLDTYSGFISTGSAASCNDDEPWIKTLKNFLKKLHKEKKKFVGDLFRASING